MIFSENRLPLFRVMLSYVERVAMRNPLGLMLASVVAAVVIAGVWFWTSSPRADAAPQTVAARKAEPLPAPAAKTAARDDVEVTAALSKPAPPVPAPAPAKSTCANPD